jgi:hypothetical protein
VSGWDKLSGKNSLDLNGFADHPVRCISAVFLQTGHNLRVFSTGTEKVGFTRFSKTQVKIERKSEPVWGLFHSF